MQYHYKQRIHLAFGWACTLACAVFLLSLLTGCQLGTTPSPVVNATATAQAAGQPTPQPNRGTPVTSPTPIPVLQTDCPAHGQARAMITTPLTLGTHPALVYSVDASANLIPTSAILRRYDPVTGVKTDIVTLPLVAISHAQLSPDGQWALFTTTDKQGSIKLQTVRLDGQGLQTLYCTTKPGLDSLQWSPTQQFVAFSDGGPGNAQTSIYLLNLATGTLQIEVPLSLNQSTLVRTWADKTRVYLTDTPVNGLFTTIYLLDTSKEAEQPLSSLAVVAHGSFTDFDSTPEGTQLFTVTNSCRAGTCTTPNSINAMPITGGPAHPILTSSTYAIEQVRAIGKNKLLFIVIDSLKGENGLWMMNTDGTGRLHLTTDSIATPTFQWSSLNLSSQYSWSNVSRDGTRYALLTGHPGGGNTAYTLLYGNLIGGTPLAFASAPDGNDLMPEIAGWTTL